MRSSFWVGGVISQYDQAFVRRLFERDQAFFPLFLSPRLVNKIRAGSISESKLRKPATMTFQQMELIEAFNTKIKGPPLNIPEHSVFATADLYEKQNMVQVITCLESVARRVSTLSSSFSSSLASPQPLPPPLGMLRWILCEVFGKESCCNF